MELCSAGPLALSVPVAGIYEALAICLCLRQLQAHLNAVPLLWLMGHMQDEHLPVQMRGERSHRWL